MYDLIIIGAGPAGMAASIYAKRANLHVAVLEGNAPGGQMINTAKIENYPGKMGSGVDLALEMFNQASALGVEFIFEACKSIVDKGTYKEIIADKTYETKTILIATGMKARKLNIEGEEKYTGRGISWCALCDGSFYKDKDVVVIGGGNSALEESLYLANICNKVTIIQRSTLRAEESIINKVLENKKIEVRLNTKPISFLGDDKLNKIIVEEEHEKKEINCAGVFIYIGFEPMTDFVPNEIKDENGYIIVNNKCETKINGVYAAGDCIKKEVRQVVTATYDGAIAAINISKYLKG